MNPESHQHHWAHAAVRLSRRRLLTLGSIGALGLSLDQLLGASSAGTSSAKAAERIAESDPRIAPKADACIVIFLNGGPSHLDMWDMKPDGPSESRGEFKPIATDVPGIQLCEHLPKLAGQMKHSALVRSMHHSVNNAHALAVYTAMTGHDRGDANRIVAESSQDHPCPGAVLARVRPSSEMVAGHVALPYKTQEGAGGPPQPGFFGGWLGRNYDPLWVLNDPNAPDFAVPELSLPMEMTVERLSRRGQLLSQLGADLLDRDPQGKLSAVSGFQKDALEVLAADTTRAAFRIADEPEAMRDAYGRNIYGQSVLLARRLVESGVRVVTVSWAPDANATWDTHGSNFKKLKDPLLPQFDSACGTLLADLQERGMLDRTLVAVLGDFGRTPKINTADAGRDHWNYCYTVMLAGGGIRGGTIYGASDKAGAFPADKPTSPGDVLATMYRLLGVDPRAMLLDRFDRPHRIAPTGDPIEELLA
jgi:hypothetical protein